MQALASQLPFLANRNAEHTVPPLFWPVNCIKIEGHVALLSGPAIDKARHLLLKILKWRQLYVCPLIVHGSRPMRSQNEL